MAEVQKVYHVLIESKASLTQASVTRTVGYVSTSYREVWPEARTVCRLGTNHGDAAAKVKREFYELDEDGDLTDTPVHVGPSEYTVRRIFVENTRKQGKKRMTTVDAETFAKVLEDNNIKINAKALGLVTEILKESGGAKITVATARRLGINNADTAAGGDTEAA